MDKRVEPCYLDFRNGLCSNDIEGLFSRKTCCCTLGRGWGEKCSKCPREGSQEFLSLCGDSPEMINECAVFPDICQHGTCRNTIDSFQCECEPGFALDEVGYSCVDIDECRINPGVCGNGKCR